MWSKLLISALESQRQCDPWCALASQANPTGELQAKERHYVDGVPEDDT